MDTAKDPAFVKDIQRQKLELNPLSGWSMQDMVEKLYKTPKDVIAYAVEVQKKGMTCTLKYPGPGEEAKNIDCKG